MRLTTKQIDELEAFAADHAAWIERALSTLQQPVACVISEGYGAALSRHMQPLLDEVRESRVEIADGEAKWQAQGSHIDELEARLEEAQDERGQARAEIAALKAEIAEHDACSALDVCVCGCPEDDHELVDGWPCCDRHCECWPVHPSVARIAAALRAEVEELRRKNKPRCHCVVECVCDRSGGAE
jgi:hypothetical protein